MRLRCLRRGLMRIKYFVYPFVLEVVEGILGEVYCVFVR